ncbi:MAG: WD40 repeat domain-containing protein [Isosphaeraceae bacterium]
MVLSGGLAGMTALWLRAERHAEAARDNERKAGFLAAAETRERQHAQEQTKVATQRAEELRRRDYIGRVNLAFRESRENNVARALELLEGCPEDLRGWEWEYVRCQCHLDLNTFRDAAESVNAVAFSPDGRLIASGSGHFFAPRDGTTGDLLVRDAATGREVFSQRELPGGVRSLAFSPDGRFLAASHAHDLVAWELATGKERFRRTDPGEVAVTSLAFSPDGGTLLAGFGIINESPVKGYARLLDATTGSRIGDDLPFCDDGVWSVAFSPDGRQIALTMAGHVHVRDVKTKALVHDLRAHDGFVYAVAFSPDGRLIASAGVDRTVRLHDRQTGALIRTYTGHEGFVRSVAFSSDSGRLVSGAEDKTVKIWSVDSDRELTTLYGHTHFVESVAFNSDGLRVASAGMRGEVKVWFASQTIPFTFTLHPTPSWVRAIAFRPDGRRIASATSQSYVDHRTLVWDPSTGEPFQWLPTGQTRNVAFLDDGRHLVVGEANVPARLWDLETGSPCLALPGQEGVWVLTTSPDGRLVAAGGGSDASLRIWDAASGRLIRTFTDVGSHISPPSFSPDGRLVAVGSSGSHGHVDPQAETVVRIWELASCSEVHRLKGHSHGGVGGIVFLPDGQRLVTVGGGDHESGAQLKVWNVATGRLLRDVPGHTDVIGAVAISPDGRRLATGGDDRLIKLWDTATFDEIFTLRGHQSGVIALAFSPDGRRLVSGSIDHTAKVWDIEAPSLETLYRRAAVAVVWPLFDRLRDPDRVIWAIDADRTLTPPIRKEAIDIVRRLARISR